MIWYSEGTDLLPQNGMHLYGHLCYNKCPTSDEEKEQLLEISKCIAAAQNAVFVMARETPTFNRMVRTEVDLSDNKKVVSFTIQSGLHIYGSVVGVPATIEDKRLEAQGTFFLRF